MEAYFAELTQSSGASDFLIVRDDAALNEIGTIITPSQPRGLSSSSESYCSSFESSSCSNPCVGPPSVPIRKRSNDDLFSKVTSSRRGLAKKDVNTRVLQSFFDEVRAGPPVLESSTKKHNDHRSGKDYIHHAIRITTTRKTYLSSGEPKRKSTRWDANEAAHSPRKQSW